MSVAFGTPAGGKGEGGDERSDRDADGPPERCLESAGGAVGEESQRFLAPGVRSNRPARAADG